jgi:hypothetical protein
VTPTRRPDVERYLGLRFDLARWNCWHLARAAWLDLTGEDLGDRTPERITTAALLGRFDADVRTFRRLAGPEDPSIVLMRRDGVVPHVGVCFGGRVLQVRPEGASYLRVPAATAGWADVGFYR